MTCHGKYNLVILWKCNSMVMQAWWQKRPDLSCTGRFWHPSSGTLLPRWWWSKTVNPLDSRRGNFDSTRGWVCFRTHFPGRPRIWLVDSGPGSVIGLFEGAKTQQTRNLIGWQWFQLCDWMIWGCQDPEEPKVGSQIAFSRSVLAKFSPWV